MRPRRGGSRHGRRIITCTSGSGAGTASSPPSMVRSATCRPFQGNGIPVRISIQDNPGSQTLLNRRLSLVVRESGILRFLNRLSGTAVGDFLGPSEREANRFNADAFRALRADIAALLQ